eukprot:scaffold10919_cov17-Tisochrysis_lutea.AAC.1
MDLHFLPGCEHSIISNMLTEHHNFASIILFEGVNKSPLGAGLVFMDIGSADCLALLSLQISEGSTDGSLPKYTFPIGNSTQLAQRNLQIPAYASNRTIFSYLFP